MTAVSSNTRLNKTPGRILALFAAGGLLILSGSASSQTITPQSVDPWQHFIDCAGVLISAPDIHAQYCLPSNNPPETKSLAPSGDGGCRLLDTVLDGTDDAYGCRLPDDDIGQDDVRE